MKLTAQSSMAKISLVLEMVKLPTTGGENDPAVSADVARKLPRLAVTPANCWYTSCADLPSCSFLVMYEHLMRHLCAK